MLLLLTRMVTHAAPLTVAVYDFKGDADTLGIGGKVTALLTADLTKETNLVMIERADLKKALNEQAFSVSGMVSSDAAAKIGQLTGAKVLVAGQVLKNGENHVIIVADIIGTETGRLFAEQIEGSPQEVAKLTADLSRKIADSVCDHSNSLVMPAPESRDEFLRRVVNGLTGTNRPSVSIKIVQYNHLGNEWRDGAPENELGAVLMKAGFTVLTDTSDRKPDREITGRLCTDLGPQRGGFITGRASLDLKVTERRSGIITALDRQESTVTGVGNLVVERSSIVKAVDDLAERIVPLLAR